MDVDIPSAALPEPSDSDCELVPMPHVAKKASRSWDEMLADIDAALSGDVAEIESIKEILASYTSNPSDWKKYAIFDPFKYTRNLVSDGNGKYNLLVLAWDVGKSSPIHDHAGAHCFVKMLDGCLTEELFETPTTTGQALVEKSTTEFHTNEVAYIDDSIGLHRMGNESHTETALSLHLYSPPYQECKVFDERSGTSKPSGRMTFYSRGGVKLL